jgi:hypothetical protein
MSPIGGSFERKCIASFELRKLWSSKPDFRIKNEAGEQ